MGGAQRQGRPIPPAAPCTQKPSPHLCHPSATSSCPSRAWRCGQGQRGAERGLQPHSTALRLSHHPSSKQHTARPQPASGTMLKSSLLACSAEAPWATDPTCKQIHELNQEILRGNPSGAIMHQCSCCLSPTGQSDNSSKHCLECSYRRAFCLKNKPQLSFPRIHDYS